MLGRKRGRALRAFLLPSGKCFRFIEKDDMQRLQFY